MKVKTSISNLVNNGIILEVNFIDIPPIKLIYTRHDSQEYLSVLKTLIIKSFPFENEQEAKKWLDDLEDEIIKLIKSNLLTLKKFEKLVGEKEISI